MIDSQLQERLHLKEQNKRMGISTIEMYYCHELFSMQTRN